MSRVQFSLLLALWLGLWPGEVLAAQDEREPHTGPKLPFQLHPAPSAAASPRAGAPDQPLPLAPPRRTAAGNSTRPGTASATQALGTVISSLAVVLGLFALVVWFTRRTRPRAMAKLPGDVIQTLGRAPLLGQQEMQLVRVGNKLLLLSVTATSAETLTEITDPVEIERLASLCRHDPAGSLSASLRQTLVQLGSR